MLPLDIWIDIKISVITDVERSSPPLSPVSITDLECSYHEPNILWYCRLWFLFVEQICYWRTVPLYFLYLLSMKTPSGSSIISTSNFSLFCCFPEWWNKHPHSMCRHQLDYHGNMQRQESFVAIAKHNLFVHVSLCHFKSQSWQRCAPISVWYNRHCTPLDNKV